MTIYFFLLMIAFLFLFQIALLFYLVIRKKKRQRYEEEIESQYNHLTEPFSSYIIEPSDVRFLYAIRSTRHQAVVLERLLNGYVAFTKEANISPLVKQLSEEFLTEPYSRILGQRNWARRINTLHYIEDFHMASLSPVLFERLTAANKLDVETQQLIRTLASLDETKVSKELSRFPNVPIRLYVDVFNRLQKEGTVKEIQSALDGTDVTLKYAALVFIGQSGAMSFLPAVEKELESSHAETRIQALKTLFRLEYMSDPDLLAPFFESSIWTERMFAARIAGILQFSRYKKILSTLLGDSVWWVRYSAAEAFTHFSDGDVILAHLSENHSDRYGRDMAAQWQIYRPGGAN
ncbi:HEAT repeat domain-containing protein [Domibacillus sp. A3M-37]|uniref:HEAT repeat domain-containing protein n=1 Tax=Domibacillus TaxID=1433999 RepID=UPI000617CAC0|nr:MULTISPECIES: HEAT domain-containing protein [Domibacillus]MCP3761062.1 HEAT repeat domain-containing protein [Domibacillus sp. A3M-37]